MSKKSYTNFEVKEEWQTAQEPVKTNHAALDEIRKMQMKPREIRIAPNVKTTVINTNMSFNKWAETIIGKLKR